MTPRSRVELPWGVLVTGVACLAVLVVLAALWYLPPARTSVLPSNGSSDHLTTVWVFDVDFAPDYLTSNTSSSNFGYLTTPTCYPKAEPSAGCPPGSGYIVTPECPGIPYQCVNATPGSMFTYDLELIDNATSSRTIQTISVMTPFVLEATTPTLPYAMTPGLPATTFQLEVLAPASPGFYDMSGVVTCY